MIDTQFFHDVLLVLVVLIGLATALSGVMLIAPSMSRPARPGRPAVPPWPRSSW